MKMLTDRYRYLNRKDAKSVKTDVKINKFELASLCKLVSTRAFNIYTTYPCALF